MDCSSVFYYQQFSKTFAIFSIFLNPFCIFDHFLSLSSLGPSPRFDNKLLHSFSSASGMVFKIFMTSAINICLQKITFFLNFWRIFIRLQVYWSLWASETIYSLKGIMDSLLRQGNCFEDFDILNFIKILFKLAFVFKIFEYFCLFSEFHHYYERSFSSLSDGLLDIKPQTKNCLEHFHLEIWKLF